MLDCGLNAQTVLNFLPMPLIHSSKFTSLVPWNPRDSETQIDGVSRKIR